jgi:hypothetical protein
VHIFKVVINQAIRDIIQKVMNRSLFDSKGLELEAPSDPEPQALLAKPSPTSSRNASPSPSHEESSSSKLSEEKDEDVKIREFVHPFLSIELLKNPSVSSADIKGAALDEPLSSFETQKRELEKEPWYFGAMNRVEAAELMNTAGDFLVRESSRKKGQFVLTVRNEDRVKHLNLLDEDGMVVNRTMSFESVKELIDYHIKTKDYIVIDGEKYFLGQPAKNP